jgi:hypothetical protein
MKKRQNFTFKVLFLSVLWFCVLFLSKLYLGGLAIVLVKKG